MILEAPLSGAFDTLGNPQARGQFEARPKARWWSLGAGASMALAAQHFLYRLHILSRDGTQIHLVEGYVVGAESNDHKDVAKRLLRGLNSDVAVRWHRPLGAEVTSILQWLPGQADREIPVILTLPRPR